MTVTHRRILYGTFFLLFFLFAPILLLATAGYRIDVSRHTLIKTSTIVLSLQTVPDVIVLDNKARHPRDTTIRFNALTPGIHFLHIEKSGYYPWEKTLSVTSGEAVSLADIHMIRRSASQIVAQTVDAFALSPDQKTIAIVHQQTPSLLTLYDVSNRTETPVVTTGLPDVITDVAWSPSGRQLLLRGDPDIWIILSPFNERPTVQALLIPRGTERVAWDPLQSDDLLMIRNGVLSRWVIADHTATPLAQYVADWVTLSGTLYALQQTNDGHIIISIKANATINTLVTIPGLLHPAFLPSPSGILTVLDTQQFTLTLVDPSSSPIRTVTYHNTAFASWNASGADLVLGNSVELLTVHHPLDEPNLLTITRMAAGFSSATWLNATPYILVRQRNSVKIYEAAFGSPYQSYTVAPSPQRNATPFNKGDNALFLDTKGILVSIPLT